MTIRTFAASSVALAALLVSAAEPRPAAAAPVFFAGANPALPFSSAVRVGDTVYVSGQIGVDASGKLPAGFSDQARNAMRNVAGALAPTGAGMGDIFQCDVSLADMKDWPAFNEVYRTFFRPGAYPVRMVTGASGLAKGAAVEVECEA